MRVRQRNCFEFLFLVASTFLCAIAQTPSGAGVIYEPELPTKSNAYPLTKDSQVKPGVAKGKVFEFQISQSKIFPNATRTISVYIPANYRSSKPACVYVGLDQLAFNVPVVFDNLIAQGAMPITIAVGVGPGVVESARAGENPRLDRSFEFDAVNDHLARFLLEEVLPEVQRHRTPDGDAIVLSVDADDRAIGGASTGGIGAFNVAWQRPDSFHRVFSAIGTYVGMRGAESLYVQVRKTEPEPIRIFMQDGVYDEWPGGPEMGDWWMSNVTMERALSFAGYDVKHVWGSGAHNPAQAAAVFPEAMRWLWSGWPEGVRPKAPGNPRLQEILFANEEWHAVASICPSAGTHTAVRLGADAQGGIYYARSLNAVSSLLANGSVAGACLPAVGSVPLAGGEDGRLYVASPSGGIDLSHAGDAGARQGHVGGSHAVFDFVRSASGDIYATVELESGRGELWMFRANGQEERLDAELAGACGLALSPDGLWLFVAQRNSHSGISYRVNNGGLVDARDPFYALVGGDDVGAVSAAVDVAGRMYVATRLGVQVMDRNGRVIAILPMPGGGAAEGIAFGGDDFNTLFVTSGGSIYRRKLAVQGYRPGSILKVLPKGSAG